MCDTASTKISLETRTAASAVLTNATSSVSKAAHGIHGFDAQKKTDKIDFMGSTFECVKTQDLAHYLQRFNTTMWFTYRRDFEPIERMAITSDAGWGCMLRSAQMILAQALQRHMLCTSSDSVNDRRRVNQQMLRWFADTAQVDSLFSLHNMLSCGIKYGKAPGEWYGPTTAAYVLRDLVNTPHTRKRLSLAVLVVTDGVIYQETVEKLCCECAQSQQTNHEDCPPAAAPVAKSSHESENMKKPSAMIDPLLNPPELLPPAPWNVGLLILLPLRLGLDSLDKASTSGLVQSFSFPQSVGIMGGKRAHSVYFYASQGTDLHILDPHTVQKALTCKHITEEDQKSVQCPQPLVMPVTHIDPSLAFGFYCRDRADFEDFCIRVKSVAAKSTFFISIANKAPDYGGLDDDMDLASVKEDGDTDEEDDYVLV